MITVPEAARRLGKNPETIRRWIREGKLPAQRIGTQHLIAEADLEQVGDGEQLPMPEAWRRLPDGRPMPNIVRAIRLSRAGR
jgi:excisionase family DNA binding protein